MGGITVIAGMGSYSRMLWKTTDYNSLRRQQDHLKQQYTQLQSQVKDTNQRLTSLQSLAGEVASAYGIARFKQTPFGLTDPAAQPDRTATPRFRPRSQNSAIREKRRRGCHVERRHAVASGC